MSVRNLEYLFQPKSVAVFGASIRPRSVGATVMHNLLRSDFDGPIMPVNPKYRAVAGVLTYPDVESLPQTPDLAVLCTPPRTIPGLIRELGDRGTRAVAVLTAGLDRESNEGNADAGNESGETIQQAMLDAARPNLVRILGPNCLGIMVPHMGLNASFAHANAQPGKIAFVSQSGALATSVLDWAKSSGIGFSCFVSLGNSADIDFGDAIDYLASDPNTQSILLYIESIQEPRKFMSAVRAAARNKPVIAVKAGRMQEGARAAASHTGALAGADDVFDAALRRAGVLRVKTIESLFDAVETLARTKPLRGERLTIFTNGGGPGVMATDALAEGGGHLASLADETIETLDAALPATWSRGNPVDIIGDAPPERYVDTLNALLKDKETDAIVFIHSPTAIVPSTEIAQALAPVAQEANRNILSCWLGRDGVAAARDIFSEAGLPTYDTPEDAVGGFLQRVNYRRNHEMLMETPPSVLSGFQPDVKEVRQIIETALADEREWLTEPEAKLVLAAYDVPTVETHIARTPAECEAVAGEIGAAVAIKILSPDITHKSDVGGVTLDLDTPEAVRTAAEEMLKRVQAIRPDADVTGFTVQEMARRPGAHELILGVTTDPIFGPVILFGQGGTATEVIRDRAMALPPLNVTLARHLVQETRVAKLLAGYRDRPAADFDAIYLTLVKLSQMIIDVPEITELDINPLFADEEGVLALDARMRVQPAAVETGAERLAIRPYPQELEEWASYEDGEVLLRPIRPEDEPQHQAFFSKLDREDVRMRFFRYISEMPHSQMARFTQIDFDREMAFIATRTSDDGLPETLGVARGITDADNNEAEFAVIVRSDMKGKGLGRLLMEKLVRYFRTQGTKRLIGETLSENREMKGLASELGFEVRQGDDFETVELELDLTKV